MTTVIAPGAGSFLRSVFRYAEVVGSIVHSRVISGGRADLHALTDFRADGDAHATGNGTDAVLHVRRDGDSNGPADGLAGL